MKTKPILYLASTSKSRQELLKQAKIPFQILEQNADESYCDLTNIKDIVYYIAKSKMKHVILEDGKEKEICYVLTADTLCQDNYKRILGKPSNKEEAISQIKSISEGPVSIATAYCLERKIYKNKWITDKQICEVVTTVCEFKMPDYFIEEYLSKTNYLNIAGSITIEGLGGQFLKKIDGSYSGIIGLPLYEVRKSLEELSFFQ